VQRDAQGYARLSGTVITGNKLLRYGRADGQDGEIVELVPPETVAEPAAIESLLHKPITHLHPPSMLDASNTARHQSGTVTKLDIVDGRMDFEGLFTDQRLLDAIDGGTVEVSAGYTARIDRTPGELSGARYDAIQRERRYNHLAIVPAGRAGSSSSLHLDGGPAANCYVQRLDEDATVSKSETSPEPPRSAAETTQGEPMSEDKQDNGPPPETQEQPSEASRADELRAAFESFQPEMVSAVAAEVVKNIDAAAAKREDSARIREEIVVAATAAVGPEFKADGKSNDEMMREAVAALQPALKEKADGSEGDALRGIFDAAMLMPKPEVQRPKQHALGDFAGSRNDSKVDTWEAKYDAIRNAFLNKKMGGVELCRAVDAGEIAVGA
jgi:hypothetical protein